VQNIGSRTWPTALPDGSEVPHVVRLVAEWRAAGSRTSVPPVLSTPLRIPIDVDPLDTVAFEAFLEAPPPGDYDVTLRVEQPGGASFAGRGNFPLAVRLRVPAIERRDGEPPTEPMAPAEPLDS